MNNHPTSISAPSLWVRIYMAGDYALAKQICREFCFQKGLCVNISPADYIYTGGEESGFVVELINYPRFPVDLLLLEERASLLARDLRVRLCQGSYCVMTPKNTNWISYRGDK